MDRVRTLVLGEGVEPPVDGTGVTVAVIDTGVSAEHPDLIDAIDRVRAKSFLLTDSRTDDFLGHGTHVAGIVAASGEASEGKYRGIAPGATILPIRAFDAHGRANSDAVAAAVLYAMKLGVDIINYSASREAWGKTGGPPPWGWSNRLSVVDQAFLAAARHGILCVAAVGNDGPNPGSVLRPGALKPILGVGATCWDGTVSEGSARGPVYEWPGASKNGVRRLNLDDPAETAKAREYMKPDLAAPGGDFISPYARPENQIVNRTLDSPGGIVAPRSASGAYPGVPPWDPDAAYTRIGGTSQAAAVASGLAALALEYARRQQLDLGDKPGIPLRRILCESGAPVPGAESQDCGRGMVAWSRIRDCIDDCCRDGLRKRNVFEGPQLHVI